MQKFEHRDIYDVREKEARHGEVHQDDSCSDTEREVQEFNVDGDLHMVQDDGEVTIVEGNLGDLIARNKKATMEGIDDEMEEDDTILQYCSDNGSTKVDDIDSVDSDDD